MLKTDYYDWQRFILRCTFQAFVATMFVYVFILSPVKILNGYLTLYLRIHAQ